MTNDDDEKIILAFQNGDQEAFRVLINRYASPVFNFSARLVGRDKAEDIVQEIFIKVWKNIYRFDQRKASFKTWLFTIAKNTTTDFLRRRKDYLFSDLEKGGEEEDSFVQNIPDEDLLPDEAMEKLEDKEFLNRTLDTLRPGYREILVLHYQEEMTFDEIGKVLGKPLNTIKSQHRRAIIELQKMLRGENAP